MLNFVHLDNFRLLFSFELLLHVLLLEYPIEVLLLKFVDLGSLVFHGLAMGEWEVGDPFIESLLVLDVTQIELLTNKVAICFHEFKLFRQFVSFHIELISNHFVPEVTDFAPFFHYFVDLIVEIAHSSLIPLVLNIRQVFMLGLLHKLVLLRRSFPHASLDICFKMRVIYTSALRRHRILPLVNFVVLLLKIRLFVEL